MLFNWIRAICFAMSGERPFLDIVIRPCLLLISKLKILSTHFNLSLAICVGDCWWLQRFLILVSKHVNNLMGDIQIRSTVLPGANDLGIFHGESSTSLKYGLEPRRIENEIAEQQHWWIGGLFLSKVFFR